jgi:dipeptidyl-peptidase III
MYDKFTSVPDDWNKLRDLVIKLRQPRKVFVQPNTELKPGGEIAIKEYDATVDGLLQSLIDRNV